MAYLTVEQVKADESVPREFIRQLDKLEIVDRTPLTKWARDSFKVGRQIKSAEGNRIIDDDRIVECIVTWAEDRQYSGLYIDEVLRQNGYYTRGAYGSKKGNFFTPKNYITTFKGIVRGLTGLRETDIMSLQSARELERSADPHLTKFVARLGESQIKEYSRQIKNLKIVLSVMESKLEEKKKGPKLTA